MATSNKNYSCSEHAVKSNQNKLIFALLMKNCVNYNTSVVITKDPQNIICLKAAGLRWLVRS